MGRLARPRQAGFTIIELVITLAIMALLATAVLPSAQLMYQRERESQLRDALRTIRNGIDAYKKASDSGRIKKDADKSGYPPDLQEEAVKTVLQQAELLCAEWAS